MVKKNPRFFLKVENLSMKCYGQKTKVTDVVERNMVKTGGYRADLLFRVIPAKYTLSVLSRGQETEGNLACLTAEQLDFRGLHQNERLVVYDPTELTPVNGKPGEYIFRDPSRKLSAISRVFAPKYFRQ